MIFHPWMDRLLDSAVNKQIDIFFVGSMTRHPFSRISSVIVISDRLGSLSVAGVSGCRAHTQLRRGSETQRSNHKSLSRLKAEKNAECFTQLIE